MAIKIRLLNAYCMPLSPGQGRELPFVLLVGKLRGWEAESLACAPTARQAAGWDLRAGLAEAGVPHLSASSKVECGMCCPDHSASRVTCYLLLATQGPLSPRWKALWLEGTWEVIKSHLLPSAAGLLAKFPMVFWLLLEHFLVTAEEPFMKQFLHTC